MTDQHTPSNEQTESNCPKCGSPSTSGDGDGDFIYACGTIYGGGMCDSQSPRCERLQNVFFAVRVMPKLEFAKYVAMLEETIEGLQANNARFVSSHAAMQAVVTAAEELINHTWDVKDDKGFVYGTGVQIGRLENLRSALAAVRGAS